jgi:AcrR family transcriptional regulator
VGLGDAAPLGVVPADGVRDAVATEPRSPREIMRDVREARREAVSEAREAAREIARGARESEREMARQLRENRVAAQHHRREPGEPDTRQRIQQIALELFTENGYEATSLREIAERLGVTKAALYYHFRTKDDIIESLVSDRMARLEELIVWADAQPRTLATRREALRRYSDMLHEQGHHGLMRFFERNQSSMTQHKSGVAMRERMIRMLDVLSDRDASMQEQIRCSLAIFALHSTWFTIRDPHATDDQRREAALEVALDLVDGRKTSTD